MISPPGNMKEQIKAIHIGGFDLELYTAGHVFEPNLTTRLLAESATIPEGCSVLDLGCGVGPIAIIAAKRGAGEVYAVDIMEEACDYARKNAERNGVADRVRVIRSDLFSHIPDRKFDVIINDVSGMAESVSRISPWYPPSIPTGGYDGTEPTIRMLSEARKHLTENGVLYFPVLSLADQGKILEKARELYQHGLEPVSRKMVPFCQEFKDRLHDLEAIKKQGIIDFFVKRSRYLWSLEIYRATA